MKSCCEQQITNTLDTIRILQLGYNDNLFLACQLLKRHGAFIKCIPIIEGCLETNVLATSETEDYDIVVFCSSEIADKNLVSRLQEVHCQKSRVLCDVNNFNLDDDRYKLPLHNAIVAAASGMISPNSLTNEVREIKEQDLSVIQAFCSLYIMFGILIALYARNDINKNQHVSISLADVMREISVEPTNNISEVYPLSPDERTAALINGQYGICAGGSHVCKDGRYIKFWPRHPKFMKWLVSEMQNPLLTLETLPTPLELRRDKELRSDFKKQIKSIFLQKTAAEWEAIGIKARIPLVMHRTTEEWLSTEQFKELCIYAGDEQKALSSMFSDSEFISLLEPKGGYLSVADREETDQQPFLDTRKYQPLCGVVALDTTQVLAGPTSTRLLADFGAKVIKINDPKDITYNFHYRINRGKQSCLLDIFSKKGLEILRKLVKKSDVFIQNFAVGQADTHGFGADELTSLNPKLTYCSITPYGHRGPWAEARGYESLAQAVTGIDGFTRQDSDEILIPIYKADLGCGLLASIGILLSLIRRQSGKRPLLVDTSLAHAASFHLLTSYLKSKNSNYLQAVFPTIDGHISVVIKEQDLSILKTLGLLSTTEVTGKIKDILHQKLATKSSQFWINKLQEAGLAAHSVYSISDTLNDVNANKTGSILSAFHNGKLIRMPASPVRLRNHNQEHTLQLPDVLHFMELAQNHDFSFSTMYGQTEASPRMTFLNYSDAKDRLGSVGKVLASGYLRIENKDEKGIGEIVYEGPNVMLGYGTCRADLSQAGNTMQELWTGDLGYLDDEFLYITGRKDRLAKIAGNRFQLEDIEQQFFDINDVAILPNGNRYVIFTEGPTAKIKQRCEEIFPPVGIWPSLFQIIEIPEIPRTQSGKINFKCLKNQLPIT